MADTAKLIAATDAFATLCRALDGNDWNYKKDEANLRVECGAQGDDLPMELIIAVDQDRQAVILMSQLPYKITEEKRVEIAVAVASVNNVLVQGNFDYDVLTGRLFFRLSNSIRGCKLSEEVMMRSILLACQTVDEYNDRFLMLSKGILTLEKFLELNQG